MKAAGKVEETGKEERWIPFRNGGNPSEKDTETGKTVSVLDAETGVSGGYKVRSDSQSTIRSKEKTNST